MKVCQSGSLWGLVCNRDVSSLLSSFWLSLIGSCVEQRLTDQVDSHSFPNLKTSTLQIASLLFPQHVATYRRRPTGSLGLTINTSKIQVLCINAIPDAPITADGEPLDLVEEFTYLGSLVAKDSAAQKDTKARLEKARVTVARLQPIWKSRQYSLRTKLRLYNSIVKPVLLSGSECWRVLKGDTNKISAFHSGCLRRICRVVWPKKVSNEWLYKKTNSQNGVVVIQCRRIQWLGHVLRMDQVRIPKTASDRHHLEEGSKGGPEQLVDVP